MTQRIRITLLLILAMIGALALVSSWSWRRHQIKMEHWQSEGQLVAEIEEFGGSVAVRHPTYVEHFLGPRYGLINVRVSLAKRDCRSFDFSRLEVFDRLEILELVDCVLDSSQLEDIGRLRSLRQLRLRNSRIIGESIQGIEALPVIEVIDLVGVGLPDEEVERTAKQLPNTIILR